MLLVDNFYLILTLFEEPERFETTNEIRYDFIAFILSYLLIINDRTDSIEKINQNTLFNNNLITNDLLKAFLHLLAKDSSSAVDSATSSNKSKQNRQIFDSLKKHFDLRQ